MFAMLVIAAMSFFPPVPVNPGVPGAVSGGNSAEVVAVELVDGGAAVVIVGDGASFAAVKMSPFVDQELMVSVYYELVGACDYTEYPCGAESYTTLQVAEAIMSGEYYNDLVDGARFAVIEPLYPGVIAYDMEHSAVDRTWSIRVETSLPDGGFTCTYVAGMWDCGREPQSGRLRNLWELTHDLLAEVGRGVPQSGYSRYYAEFVQDVARLFD